jgi:hypothetical protein
MKKKRKKGIRCQIQRGSQVYTQVTTQRSKDQEKNQLIWYASTKINGYQRNRQQSDAGELQELHGQLK